MREITRTKVREKMCESKNGGDKKEKGTQSESKEYKLNNKDVFLPTSTSHVNTCRKTEADEHHLPRKQTLARRSALPRRLSTYLRCKVSAMFVSSSRHTPAGSGGQLYPPVTSYSPQVWPPRARGGVCAIPGCPS